MTWGPSEESKQPSQKVFSLLAPVSSSAFPSMLHFFSFSENDQGSSCLRNARVCCDVKLVQYLL